MGRIREMRVIPCLVGTVLSCFDTLGVLGGCSAFWGALLQDPLGFAGMLYMHTALSVFVFVFLDGFNRMRPPLK